MCPLCLIIGVYSRPFLLFCVRWLRHPLYIRTVSIQVDDSCDDAARHCIRSLPCLFCRPFHPHASCYHFQSILFSFLLIRLTYHYVYTYSKVYRRNICTIRYGRAHVLSDITVRTGIITAYYAERKVDRVHCASISYILVTVRELMLFVFEKRSIKTCSTTRQSQGT